MAVLTDAQIEALNNWARTEPTLRTAFDYTRTQGVPGEVPPSRGLGDTLAADDEDEMATLQREVDFTNSDQFVYQGSADAGTKTSEAKWRITRTEFVPNSPNSDDVIVLYAENDTGFVHVWDDRVSLSYGT